MSLVRHPPSPQEPFGFSMWCVQAQYYGKVSPGRPWQKPSQSKVGGWWRTAGKGLGRKSGLLRPGCPDLEVGLETESVYVGICSVPDGCFSLGGEKDIAKS